MITADASEELEEFAKRINAPVALTLMGIGAFPPDSPNYTGMIGMHGTEASAKCVQECDLLIAIGTRFSERVTAGDFAKNAKILHIDIDAAEINKNVAADQFLCGDAKQILAILNKRVHRNGKNSLIEEVKNVKPAM